MTIFNQVLVERRKTNSIGNIKNSDFYRFIYSDLMQRLEPINRTFKEGIVLGFGNYPVFPINNSHRLKYENIEQLVLIEKKSIDLVIFPFGFHWLNDVQKFLFKVKEILKNDGIFICNFAGAGSLNNLRKLLFLAEESNHLPHFPHISPFIKFEDMTPLMQQAGFAENVVDCETIELEYENPILFMRALKGVGETNAISNRIDYSITKPMYNYIKNFNRNFLDQINLISVVSSPAKGSIKLKAENFFGGC